MNETDAGKMEGMGDGEGEREEEERRGDRRGRGIKWDRENREMYK